MISHAAPPIRALVVLQFIVLKSVALFSSSAGLHPSRFVVNTTIWAIGILLQSALVYSIFRKGITRAFPGFAILAVFYPLRSALLFALSGRIENDDYTTLSNALSLAEPPLQAFVAFELLLSRARSTGGWTARRIALLSLIPCLAIALTIVTIHAVPARGQAGMDRVPLFMGFVLLAVFAAIVKSPPSVNATRTMNAIRIAGGFACFALAQLVSLAGRAHAMLLRDTPAYLAWGYLPAVSYLAVVLFWIVALQPQPRNTIHTAPSS